VHPSEATGPEVLAETALAAPARAGNLAGAARRRLSATIQVWAFTTLLAGAATALIAGYLVEQPARPAPIELPWPVLAVAFFAAELKVIDVHFRREKHSFSLSEVPAVVGFFLVPPGAFFLALLTGTGLALMVLRERPLRLAFNLADYAFVWAVAMAAFQLVGEPAPVPGPRDWAAAFLATGIGAVVSSITIATAISLSGGAPQFQKLPEMVQFGGLVAVANTSLALLAVASLYLQPPLLFLLVIPLATVFLAYRAYMSEREKHQRLEMLYQSSRILQHSPELDSALSALLHHVREMFRAERAEVLLWPSDDRGEGLLTTAVQDGPEGHDGAEEAARRGAAPPPGGSHASCVPAPRRRPDARRRTPRHGCSAPGRVPADRVDADRQPAHRGHHLRGRGPAPAGDAREPGIRRPRERPAGAVAQ